MPAGFDAWFARGTHRDISRRFQTARELLEALAPICGVAQVSLTPANPALVAANPTLAAASTILDTLPPSTLDATGRVALRPWLAAALALLCVVVIAAVVALPGYGRRTGLEAAAPETMVPAAVAPPLQPRVEVVPLRPARDAAALTTGPRVTPQVSLSAPPDELERATTASPAGRAAPKRDRRTLKASPAKKRSAAEQPAPTGDEGIEVNGRWMRTTLK